MGSTTIRGEELRVDINAAKSAAQGYLNAAGVQGSVTVVNGDNLIERVELYGPIFASESTDVEKRIDLSGFNEPVEIEKPVV